MPHPAWAEPDEKGHNLRLVPGGRRSADGRLANGSLPGRVARRGPAISDAGSGRRGPQQLLYGRSVRVLRRHDDRRVIGRPFEVRVAAPGDLVLLLDTV